MTEQSGTARYPAVVALLRRERERAEAGATHYAAHYGTSDRGAVECREFVRQIDAALAALAGEDGQ